MEINEISRGVHMSDFLKLRLFLGQILMDTYLNVEIDIFHG